MKGLGLIEMGIEGVGKTGFALQFPKPLKCLSVKEEGYEDLDIIGEVPEGCENVVVKDWRQFRKELEDTSPATIVIDSTSGMQQILFEHCIQVDFEGDQDKFMDFYKGPRQVAPRYMMAMCDMLSSLRAIGTHILVLSHTETDVFKNPEGVDYSKVEIDMDKGIRQPLVKWAQSILYMTMDSGTSQVTRMEKGVAKEAKMNSGDKRVIRCDKSMTYTSKNKLKLPPVISMGSSAQEAYQNFFAKLPPKVQQSLS